MLKIMKSKIVFIKFCIIYLIKRFMKFCYNIYKNVSDNKDKSNWKFSKAVEKA